jgi:hypothetical protein
MLLARAEVFGSAESIRARGPGPARTEPLSESRARLRVSHSLTPPSGCPQSLMQLGSHSLRRRLARNHSLTAAAERELRARLDAEAAGAVEALRAEQRQVQAEALRFAEEECRQVLRRETGLQSLPVGRPAVTASRTQHSLTLHRPTRIRQAMMLLHAALFTFS